MPVARVLVEINPPDPGRCWVGSPWRHCVFVNGHGRCEAGFPRGLGPVRPVACIAAEAEATKLAEDAHEWQCEQQPPICDVDGCSREVTCGWPQGSAYRQTCSGHAAPAAEEAYAAKVNALPLTEPEA